MAFGSGTAEPTPSFLSRPAKQRYFCAMASRRVAECSGMRTPQVNRPSMMRRRRLLPHRRRRSIQNLIVGFEQLRSYLPSYLYGHRLTRLETLRLATQYIRDLTNLLLDSEGQFSADCQNTSHASTDRVRSTLPGPKSHCTRGNFSSEPLDSGVPLQIDEDECPKLPMVSRVTLGANCNHKINISISLFIVCVKIPNMVLFWCFFSTRRNGPHFKHSKHSHLMSLCLKHWCLQQLCLNVPRPIRIFSLHQEGGATARAV